MNTLSRTARLISAAAAVAITLTMLNGMFAIAEPQRSVLQAKLHKADPAAGTRLTAAKSVTVATAATAGAGTTK